jgi:glycosyltransferase involved in cell wall biosynthesis
MNSFKDSGRRLRGAFINTGKANCSIFESGRMVYECIANSQHYDLDYLSLDMFDVDLFARTGEVLLLSGQGSESRRYRDYDFWVFNWHFYTMGSILPVEVLQRIDGLKFSIVLELDPDDPLALIPRGAFDGHIALDPNAEPTAEVFPFPRPLEWPCRKPPPVSKGPPTIGSFGFGTPGKGFELLVEAVNCEFDRATVRVNIPVGAHTGASVGFHRTDYPRYIEQMCRRIAKPGIEVVFTYDFMSPEAVVDWCAANDLNCFMYTRQQPGLSATTDQAVLSGRPLLTLANDTFRHIHKYMRPYPEASFREALETHAAPVAAIQQDWSQENFQRTFHHMLQSFGLMRNPDGPPRRPGNDRRRAVVLHAHFDSGYRDDFLNYTKRLTDSLKRIGDWSVVTAQLSSADQLREKAAQLRPDVVVVSAADDLNAADLADALRDVSGPKVVVSDAAEQWTGTPFSVQPERPIIPFCTVQSLLREGPPAIWLIGFGDPASELEQVVNKIAAELPAADIFVVQLQPNDPALEARIEALQAKFKDSTVRILPQGLPATGREVVDFLGGGSLLVIHADPRHPREVEAIASLGMITERAVVFTRSGVPDYARSGRIFEAAPVPELIAAGISAQIGLLADLGEWTMARDIRALARGWEELVRGARADEPATATPALQSPAAKRAPETIMSAAEILALPTDAAFVRAVYRSALGRRPDPDGETHHRALLVAGEPRESVLLAIAKSPEAQATGRQIRGLSSLAWRRKLKRISPVRSVLTKYLLARAKFSVPPIPGLGRRPGSHPLGWTADKILAQPDDSAFIHAAYRAALGRSPDPAGEAHHQAQLASGTPRGLVLLGIANSAEARAGGRMIAGLPGLAWRLRIHRMPLVRTVFRRTRPGRDAISQNALRSDPRNAHWSSAVAILGIPDDQTFIRTAYQAALGRLPDPEGEAFHRAQLLRGRSRGSVLLGIAKSQEAKASGRWVAGLRGLSWRMRLHSVPIVAHAFRYCRPGRDIISQNALRGGAASLRQSLREIEHSLERLANKQAATIAELKAPLRRPPPSEPVSSASAAGPPLLSAEALARARIAVERPENVKPDIALFVGVVEDLAGSLSDGVRQFVNGCAEAGDIRLVAWSRDTRKLKTVDIGTEGTVSASDLPAHSPSTPSRAGWLLALDPVQATPGSSDLLAVDVIMDAHRAGLRTAFVFHGADPLRRPEDAGPVAEAHGNYIQALLLADAILPTSQGAAQDLSIVLSQHHAATWSSPITIVTAPRDAAGWPAYVHAIEEALEATEPALRVRSIYFWMGSALRRAFSLRLARELTSAGVAVIPIGRDPAMGAIGHATPIDFTRSDAQSIRWGDWIDPANSDAPAWVLLPAGATSEESGQIAAFAAARGLRVAAILGEEDRWSDEAAYARLAGIDKVLALSDEDYHDFYGFLLSSRSKALSAEDRFRTLPKPGGRIAGGHDEDWAAYVRSLRTALATDRLRDTRNFLARPDQDAYREFPNLARRPKLSLCLSTYNRAGWLKRNLENIYSQISSDRTDLEVLVVDNTSTDNTPDIAAAFLGKPNFSYIRNRKNVGMLGNLAVTAQRAQGEYIWIIGDDDLTRAGCINKVLDVLAAHPRIGLVYLNYGYTSEPNPLGITDLPAFLDAYNVLEPAGPDEMSTARQLAAKCENFYTAIYSHAYRRDHAMRAYCQDTSGRPFSTMLTCIPTAYYVLHQMPDEAAFWIGEPSLVVNSNVSWIDYGPLFDLEQLPRAWDLAERNGCDPAAVDRRRANRLWLVAMMWKDMFENDRAGNSPYFDAARVLMRLKHLPEIDTYIPELYGIYARAHAAGHPAARMPASELFKAFPGSG